MNKVRAFFLSLLLATASLVGALPDPQHTLMMPMRDGTLLPTDVYLPSVDAQALPCILVRTPSGRKKDYLESIVSLAQAGYAVVIQDTRSTLDQEGGSMPFVSDGWGTHQDGFDTVQWLAKSNWTNGKVGTIGWSAMGITQLLMAPTSPPDLKCQYIGVAAASLYHHAMFGGGEFHKSSVESWLGYHAPHPRVAQTILSQPQYNDFWQQFNTVNVAERVTVPAVHLGGWYDLFLQGTIDGFIARENKGGAGAKGTQKLLIGPWTHFWPKEQMLGDFPVPTAGVNPPYDLSPKAWFDFYLKGINNDVLRAPSVVYYVMGPLDGTASSGNVWKTASTWPVPHTDVPFYLTEGGKLSRGRGDRDAKTLSYIYKPSDPSPTVGGRNLYMPSGAKDQRSVEERQDIVLFTTDPLEQDLEVTGRIIAKLFITTDQPDMDVAVRLCDVYPDGRSILVADGLSKISKPSNASPSAVDVDLWSTSIVFAKGHRIRISVSSSNYPAYEKCLKDGDASLTAHNGLHMGKRTPSRIILPTVPTIK